MSTTPSDRHPPRSAKIAPPQGNVSTRCQTLELTLFDGNHEAIQAARYKNSSSYAWTVDPPGDARGVALHTARQFVQDQIGWRHMSLKLPPLFPPHIAIHRTRGFSYKLDLASRVKHSQVSQNPTSAGTSVSCKRAGAPYAQRSFYKYTECMTPPANHKPRRPYLDLRHEALELHDFRSEDELDVLLRLGLGAAVHSCQSFLRQVLQLRR